MDDLTWHEMQERQKNIFIPCGKTRGDILRLNIETVPEDLRNMARLVKESAEHRKQRGRF